MGYTLRFEVRMIVRITLRDNLKLDDPISHLFPPNTNPAWVPDKTVEEEVQSRLDRAIGDGVGDVLCRHYYDMTNAVPGKFIAPSPVQNGGVEGYALTKL